MTDKKKCCLGKYGGQAVIEGVMMMGENSIATAIRKLDGEIKIEKQEYVRIIKKYKFLNIPILRGFLSFFDSMIVGIKCLLFSAEEFEIEEEKDNENDIENNIEIKEDASLPDWAVFISLIVSLAMSIGLFILLPSLVANGMKIFMSNIGVGDVFYSIIESVTRIVIFFLYLVLVSFQKDVKRVFEYHGAEHKTINCYEAGEELTVENAKKQSRFNPRCGTSFLFLVMIISIIIYSIPIFRIRTNVFATVGIRLILLPLIAGISYEFIKILGSSTGRFAKCISMPGMWFQNFTTKEPDDSQLEVAIAALNEVLDKDEE